MVRAEMPCCGSAVSYLNHSMNCVTRWVIPILYAYMCIMFHALEAYRNGATIGECTREREARGTHGT